MWKGIPSPIRNFRFRHLRRDEAVDLARRIRDGTGPGCLLRDPCELPNEAHYSLAHVRFIQGPRPKPCGGRLGQSGGRAATPFCEWRITDLSELRARVGHAPPCANTINPRRARSRELSTRGRARDAYANPREEWPPTGAVV